MNDRIIAKILNKKMGDNACSGGNFLSINLNSEKDFVDYSRRI
jgi:hypothetical protein